MKRFLKTYALLLAVLLLFVSGVNGALEYFGDPQDTSTFTCSDEQGRLLLAYAGDLARCPCFIHPRTAMPTFFRPLRARRA